MTKENLLNLIEKEKANSAWKRGVKDYAYELIEDYEDYHLNAILEELETDRTGSLYNNLSKILLNGACNWVQYSYEGFALIYDTDIAYRLCSPSEYKKCRCGRRQPNLHETWLDTQARALHQAFDLIITILNRKER